MRSLAHVVSAGGSLEGKGFGEDNYLLTASRSGVDQTKGEILKLGVSTILNTILESQHIGKLEEQYCLGEQLGWGQFGVIRACSDKFTGEKFACKSIAKERLITLDDVRSVKLEIEIMTRLSGHPNVVHLKAVYEDENFVHLVMELCAGGELFHRLEKHGRFSESEARILFRHLMLVVVYCHDKGVVHRDLKPENILLATRAVSSPIKLADFGLATYIKPGQSLHGTVGSPFYIAPEVLSGGYNQAADVWSSGVILYILLSGMPPFWGKTKSRIFDAVRAATLRFPSDPWDRISSSAKDLIKEMLCTDPAQRLTAKQVLEHSWMKDSVQLAEEPSKCEDLGSYNLDLDHDFFSTPFSSKNRDLSFGSEASIPWDAQRRDYSPAFSCKSSFSSFLVEFSTPGQEPGGFSFRSCCESNNLEFSSPIPSMSSFAFFAVCPVEQVSGRLSATVDNATVNAISRETSMGKLYSPPDTSICLVPELGKTRQRFLDTRRVGGTAGSRAIGIGSKRNRTIGLGEFEQLDVVAVESIIRWASCTHLRRAPSLRSEEVRARVVPLELNPPSVISDWNLLDSLSLPRDLGIEEQKC
ncbi:hypothetical protein Syun_031328 [Stephania yunnanensis]|uniref:non-specific serine/threonine protein kinase n=1 Tax=Stephania yunnanensis TaxID=152371 RepID=A0AAP0HEX0_9MAGN